MKAILMYFDYLFVLVAGKKDFWKLFSYFMIQWQAKG